MEVVALHIRYEGGLRIERKPVLFREEPEGRVTKSKVTVKSGP